MRKIKPLTVSAYLFFLLIFILPVVSVLSNADLKGLKEIFSSLYYAKIMGFTLFQALISTFYSLLLGLPGAFILAETDFKAKPFVKTIFSIPFILPSIIVVLAFVVFYGNTGFLNKALMRLFSLSQPPLKILYSFKTVIMAHVFYNAPLFSILLANSLENIDSSVINAARLDTRSRFELNTKILLPQITNSILSTSCLVFLYCFTSFAIILVLGGGLSMSTVEVEIYRLAKINLDIKKACCLSIFSISVATFILCTQSVFQSRSTVRQEQLSSYKKQKISPVQSLYISVAVLFVSLPLLGIITRAFLSSSTRSTPYSFSFNAFRSIDMKCFVRTFVIGIFSSSIGTAVAYILAVDSCRKKNVLKSICPMLPMAVSSVVLGLSYFIISKNLKSIPQGILLVLVHSVLVIPFSFRSILPALQNMSLIYREEALLDGCSDFSYLTKIMLPLTKNSVLSALIFGFSISCGELNSTLLLVSGKYETVPVLINRQIASYNFQGACASASVLIVLCVGVFFAANRLKENQI